ncbi:MAG: extracellular solute-binding protein [Treponema sp.]|jgi:ABC-type glycerol-3-phosphate transport system substrate-binding protein|nr:extracellular solute-binding protein [Treponema sp.]
MNAKKMAGLVFLPVLVLSAVLAARCFGPPEKEPEKTELLISVMRESGLDGDDFAPLIEEYAELHPKLLINTETRSFEELLRPRPDPAGGTAPGDVLILDGRYLRDFIDSEALFSLEDYHPSDSPLERWALPLNASIDLLFYNTDLLKKAGFDRPPGTRADYLRYARALRDMRGNTGVYGGALGLSPDDGRGVYRDILSWIWASGIPLSRDGALDFNGRALNGALDFLAALEKEKLLAPGSFEKTGEQRIGEFVEGKIGMMIGSVRDIPRLRERMGENSFGVTRIPEPEDYPGKPVFGLWVWYGAVFRQSARREAAGNFLLFLRERGPALTGQLKTVPGHAETASVRPEDPLYAKIWDMYEGADLARELLGFPGEAVLEDALRRELELMFRENRGAAETALAVQRRWDQWKP